MLLIDKKRLPARRVRYTCLVACVLAVVLSTSCFAPAALADVRKADMILGQTVESRGLSVAQSPSIDAEYALVMDAEGTVYFERNATTATQIASITKIMTALVALENAPLDAIISTSSRAANVGESSASLMEGSTMTLTVALQALLLSSGNDAALAIAEDVGRLIANTQGIDGQSLSDVDAEAVFLDRMNTRAVELGCADSVFTNPHGLDFDSWVGDLHSTAADVAIMAREAMKNETFRTIVATPEMTIEVDSGGIKVPLALTSTDQLLHDGYEGACGIKTGFTALAGQSFAAACNRGKGDMYAIVLHSSSESQRFTDAKTLFDWVYAHTVTYPLAHSEQTTTMVKDGQTTTVPLIAEVAHSEWIDKTVKATLEDPELALEVFDLSGNISQTVEYKTISGNVEAGDTVGTITFKQRNATVATANLIACESVAAPDLFKGIGIWWDRLVRGFSGQHPSAENVLLNQTPLINDKTNAQ